MPKKSSNNKKACYYLAHFKRNLELLDEVFKQKKQEWKNTVNLGCSMDSSNLASVLVTREHEEEAAIKSYSESHSESLNTTTGRLSCSSITRAVRRMYIDQHGTNADFRSFHAIRMSEPEVFRFYRTASATAPPPPPTIFVKIPSKSRSPS